MSQDKVLGEQLDIVDVAEDIAADPVASAAISSNINIASTQVSDFATAAGDVVSASEIDSLLDVSTAGAISGQVLTYGTSPSGWFPADATAVGGVSNPMTTDLNTANFSLFTATVTTAAAVADSITLTGGGNTYDNFGAGNTTIKYEAGNITLTAGGTSAYSSDGSAYGLYGENGGAVGSPAIVAGVPFGNVPGIIIVQGGDMNRSGDFIPDASVSLIGGTNTHPYASGFGGGTLVAGGDGFTGGRVTITGGKATNVGAKAGLVEIRGTTGTLSPATHGGDVLLSGSDVLSSTGLTGNVIIKGGAVLEATNNTAGGNLTIEPGAAGEHGDQGQPGKILIHSQGVTNGSYAANMGPAALHITNTTAGTGAARTFNSVRFKAPDTLPADTTFSLPGNDGSIDDLLTMKAGSPPDTEWRAPIVLKGTGAPEGSVAATVGKLYTDIAGGADTTLYIKESGTAAVGWVPVSTAAANNWLIANNGSDFSPVPTAAGADAISIGGTASYANAVAIGKGSEAINTATIAVGISAYSAGVDSTAIGQGSFVDSNQGIGIGKSAEVLAANAIAIGGSNTYVGAGADFSIVLGAGSGVDVGIQDSIRIGRAGTTSKTEQISIGKFLDENTVDTDVAYSVLIGSKDVTNKNMLHLFSKGKLELYGDEAQFVLPNYLVGSPALPAIPATTVEGGMIWDALAKQVKVYNGTLFTAVAAAGNWIVGNSGDDFATAPVASGGGYAVAIGDSSTATQDRATAIGHGADATDYYAVAIGENPTASGGGAVAIGWNAQSNNSDCVVLGTDCIATSASSIVIGDQATTGSSTSRSIIMGYKATNGNNDSNSIAIGSQAFGNAGAVAIGTSANTAYDSVAIGPSANAAESQTIAIGKSSHCTRARQIAIGVGTAFSYATESEFSTKIGYGIADANQCQVHLHSKGKLELVGDEAQFVLPNYLVGSPALPAIPATTVEGGMIWDATAKQVKVYNGTLFTAVAAAGNWIVGNAGDDFSTAPVASGDNALAAGRAATATNLHSIAIGDSTNASGFYSVALGDNPTASGNTSVAIGQNAVANSSDSIAIGTDTSSGSSYSIAIGENATIGSSSSWGIAIGTNSEVYGGDSKAIAIGFGAKTDVSAVAIGDGARAGSQGVALGQTASSAGSTYAIAIGKNADCNSASTLCIGRDSACNQSSQISIGRSVVNEVGDPSFGVKIGYGAVSTSRNMVHLHSKGKMELIGDEAQFVAPNYTFAGSPLDQPANALEGGVIYDSTVKALQVYDGTSWNAVGMKAPIFTLGTLPAVVEGATIYVSDATGSSLTGSQCFGNVSGSPAVWVDVTTGAAVA